MPNDLTIQSVNAVSAPADASAASKASGFPAPQGAQPAAAPQPFNNPTLHLDPSLGLVVIEFRNDKGAVTSTIPSQRQIEAYRMHQQTLPGEDETTPAAAPAAAAG